MEILIENIRVFFKEFQFYFFLVEIRLLILPSHWNFELIAESHVLYKEQSIFNKISRIFIPIKFPIVR